MTSEQLADYIDRFHRAALDRIRGVGNEQYSSGDLQRFEVLPLAELIDEAIAECMDIHNYSGMTAIRLERLKAAVLGGQTP